VSPSFCQNACSLQSYEKIQMAGGFWEINAAAITCPVARNAAQSGNVKGVSRRSQRPRGLRRRSGAARLLRFWVHIPPGAWIFVSCENCMLSGTDLIDELITRPEESYRLWCVLCVIWKPYEWGGHSSRWAAAPQKKVCHICQQFYDKIKGPFKLILISWYQKWKQW
jgi:hypothetical protein